MSNFRHYSIVMLFCVFLLMLPFESVSPTELIMVNESMTPAAIDITQMIPDPNLEAEPDAFVSGTSGEFQYNYSESIMKLNWTHTKGTALDFISDEDDEKPCYNDFVFFTQSFSWLYEEMPEDAIMYLNYSVTVTEGLTNTSTHNMFRVYAWFIDSSDNWQNIYYSNPPYTSDFQEKRINLNYIDILRGFGGMIEYDGIQEDPTDTLKVGVGLAPTNDFQISLDNGSVIVEVTSMKFYVIMETDPDPATFLTPLFNKTFATEPRDIFPGYRGDITHAWDFLRQMTKDPDGNLYLTGECSTSYDLRESEGLWNTHQFLIKYDPALNCRWIVRNDNLTRGRAITYHDGYIYTTGYFYREEPYYYNLMLTKWTTNGQKIWEKEWGGDCDQVGVGIGVHSDGSIYVILSDFNIHSEPSYQNASLMKFDDSGNVVWVKQLPFNTNFDAPSKIWVFENQIVFHQYLSLYIVDLNGEWQWGDLTGAVTCDENGTIYSAVRWFDGVEIRQYNLDGNETWSTYYQIQYSTGWFEDLIPYDLALTPTGELLVLVQGNIFDHSYHLLKYSIEGSHLQTWSIGDYAWPLPGQWPPHMEVTSTGLAYFAFVPMTSDVWIQAYVIGDYTLPPPEGLDIVPIAAVGGGIAVLALVGVYVYKRKQV